MKEAKKMNQPANPNQLSKRAVKPTDFKLNCYFSFSCAENLSRLMIMIWTALTISIGRGDLFLKLKDHIRI